MDRLINNIMRLMDERRMNQKDLAQAAGMDPSLLSKLIKGQREWKMSHLLAIARGFGIDIFLMPLRK